MNATQLMVSLRISAQDYQRLYSGSARTVLAYSRDGQRVRFPARILQPFVAHDGINGSFCIHFDDEYRFREIIKIDS